MATEGRDFTGLIRFQGKLFTASDISLAPIGGLALHAAGMAAVPAGILGILTLVVAWILGGFGNAFLISVGVFVVLWIPMYVVFQWDSADREKPWLRVKVWAVARLTQPTHIADRVNDQLPDDLCWQVVLQRPANSTHIHPGRPVRRGATYRPQPVASDEFVVDDDYDVFQQWFQRIADQTPSVEA